MHKIRGPARGNVRTLVTTVLCWDPDWARHLEKYPNDTGYVGVDLLPKVCVGKIPVYGTACASRDGILQKTMDHENEGSAIWRKSMLPPMSFSDRGTDGACIA